jgi:hypothetical protein
MTKRKKQKPVKADNYYNDGLSLGVKGFLLPTMKQALSAGKASRRERLLYIGGERRKLKKRCPQPT